MTPVTAHSLYEGALRHLPFTPQPEQEEALRAMCNFIADSPAQGVFVLNGYAGTGKTSITAALLQAISEAKIPLALMAPVGRAAKVASNFSGLPASTIHKRLFRGLSADPTNTDFFIAHNNQPGTIFVVDEASLIADNIADPRKSLLAILVHHVYSAPGCKLILIGDTAQLPPVGQTTPMAMNPDRLKQLGLIPEVAILNTPVRQAAESGIVFNATLVRDFIFNPPKDRELRLKLSPFVDIKAISSDELADYLADSRSAVGEDQTILITRSNSRANRFNAAIRNMVLYADSPIQRGELLVISKNDYYWSKINKSSSFIANGDMAEVTWIGKTEKMYGRYFVDVELRMLSSGATLGAKLMLRSLQSEGPSIPRDEMIRFYNTVLALQEGELTERIRAVTNDPYYNALQAKYAYCITCHKAQGGQWADVYIDMSGIQAENMDTDFYRWLYTSITRATRCVYLINPTVEYE